MKKNFKIIWNVLQILIVFHVIFITVFLFSENKYGFTQFKNYTFDIKNTDLIIIKNSKNIRKGDIIYYYSAYNKKYLILSDKVIKKDKSSYIVSNSISISKNMVVGKCIFKISYIGGFISFIESKEGFIYLVLVPIIIVFIYQLYAFLVINFKKRKRI